MTADGTVSAQVLQPAAPKADTFAGLRDSRSLETAAGGWSAAMASALDGAGLPAACVCVFLPDPASGRLLVSGTFPTERRPGVTLIASAEAAMGGTQAVMKPATGANKLSAIALPLVVEGRAMGVVGLERVGNEQSELRATLQQMQWGAAWMRDLARQAAAVAAQGKYARAVEALNAIVAVAERRGFVTAATAAVTDLATRFDCDRVALGFRRFRSSKIRAVSHSAQFSQRMSLMRMAAAAQDEAIDQRATVLWPDTDVDDIVITHAHERFAQEHGAGHVFTAPLYAMDRFVGALTFERPADKPFTQDDLEMLEAVSTVIAPIIEEKRLNDRWLITKLFAILKNQFVQLVGPGKLKRKLVAIVIAALVAFFWFAKTTDQVASDAIVRGLEQRSVVSPFEGFVAEAPVRAGDLVSNGDLLVRLDDRELQLERLRLVTTRQREQFEYDKAVAERDRSESRIRQNQITQVEAQIALIDEEITRTIIVAPFDGLIIAGDLSQSIGASVARGEQLFTLAPDGTYRVDISIDERRIADIALGQTGLLRVTALPDRTLPIEISKITPVAKHGDGATTFTVEAQLTGDTADLRPGMEGATRVDITERRLIGIWMQPIIDWARIAMWKAWPG